MILRYLIVIALCTFFWSTSVYSQKGWEVGGWLGTSIYFGDLNTNFSLKKPGLAGGLAGRYNVNERIAYKLSLNYGRIHADDKDSQNIFEQQRNLRFSSDLIELSAQFEFNFLPFVHGSKDFPFTPYIFLGGSGFYYNPKAKLDNINYSLRDYGTEGQPIGEEYGKFNGAFSLGGGFKWDLNESWSINIEIGHRRVFTDYLDDVSTTYPDLDELELLRGPIAPRLSDRSDPDVKIGDPGRQRGNSRDNDSYNFIGVGFLKYFGSLECPRISDFF